MLEIAVNVIVHYNKASASGVFLCLFIMVLILYCGVFILHLLRKARGASSIGKGGSGPGGAGGALSVITISYHTNCTRL
jgi:hypothetical protein